MRPAQNATPCFCRRSGFSPQPNRGRSQAGSAIIYSLIIIAAGAFVLAGWIHVLAARAEFTEVMSASLQRRVILENSRLLASQYLLQNVLPGSYTAAVNGSLNGGWGAFALAAPAAAVVPLQTTTQPSGLNAFAPGGSGGYSAEIEAALSDGQADQAWIFKIRSRSPIFGFDYLTSQKPTVGPGNVIDLAAGLRVADNTVFWVPAVTTDDGIRTGTYQTPTVGSGNLTPPLNGAGQAIVMSNFSFPPVTSGVAGGGLGYDGSLAVINPATSGIPYTSSLLYRAGWTPDLIGTGGVSVYSDGDPDTDPNPSVNLAENPPEATPVSGVSSDGFGTVTVNLAETGSGRIYMLGDVGTLILQGDFLATGDYYGSPTENKGDGVEVDPRPGLLIVYVQESTSARDLTTIQLQGQNNRRVYLAVKKNVSNPTAVALATTGAARWRLAATFENTPVNFSLGGNLQLIGGLRSDASLGVSGGTVDIYRESDPKWLDRHADRLVWLETYRE